MCLIIHAKTGRPKPEYLDNGATNHPDGTSIAWREGEYIHYKKDISIEELKALCISLPLGYVVHFRWASVGGKDKSLLHPFPVRKDVPLKPEGRTKRVLFHNGTWTDWSKILVNHLTSRSLLPKGKWSDTRALAFLVAVHGKNVLNLLGKAGKFVLMSTTRTLHFGDFIEEEGVFYSNATFRSITRTRGTGVSTTTTTTSTGTKTVYGFNKAGATCDPCQQSTSGELFRRAASDGADIPGSDVEIEQAQREALTPAEYQELIDMYQT